MFIIDSIHHVSLPVTDLEQSKRFYREVLGLSEIERASFDFPGTWYQLGNQQLHLIVHNNSTLHSGLATTLYYGSGPECHRAKCGTAR